MYLAIVTVSIYLGLISNINTDDGIMSSMRGLASRFILNMPFLGFVLRIWGVDSVNPKKLKKLLAEKKTIGLLPGGFE